MVTGVAEGVVVDVAAAGEGVREDA